MSNDTDEQRTTDSDGGVTRRNVNKKLAVGLAGIGAVGLFGNASGSSTSSTTTPPNWSNASGNAGTESAPFANGWIQNLHSESVDTESARVTPAGSTLTIDAGNYGSIQAAIDDIPELYAEKVIVDIPNGTYTESDIQMHGIHAHGPLNEIEIRGDPANRSNVTIDAGTNGFGLDIQYCDCAVTLNGLTVTRGDFANVLLKHVSRVNLKNIKTENCTTTDGHSGAITAVNCLVNFESNIRSTSNDNAGLFLDNCFTWNEQQRDMGPEVTGLEVDNNAIHGIAMIGTVFVIEGSDHTNADEILIHDNGAEGVYVSNNSGCKIYYATIGGNTDEGVKATNFAFADIRDSKEGAYGSNGGAADIYGQRGSYVTGSGNSGLNVSTDGTSGGDVGLTTAASGQVALSSGSATVDTGVSTTSTATFMLALGPATDDADVAGDIRADSGTGTYVIDIEETDTSVGNPSVDYDVLRVR